MRVGDLWLEPMPVALGLAGQIKKYVGLEMTLMTMNGHLMAFQLTTRHSAPTWSYPPSIEGACFSAPWSG
jgi:hypothetical protein